MWTTLYIPPFPFSNKKLLFLHAAIITADRKERRGKQVPPFLSFSPKKENEKNSRLLLLLHFLGPPTYATLF